MRSDAASSVVVKLIPSALISGAVVDENGEAIEGAQVRLLQQRMVMGKRRWATSGAAQTDDQGRFRLPNLRAGRYIVAVGPSAMTSPDAGKTGYPSIFYPKARDLASATPIEVSAGQQAEADFDMSPVPVFKVSGVVVGPKTMGINVSLADSSGNEIDLYARLEQATGEFEIRGVPRGTYMLRAHGFRQQQDPLAAHAVVVVNSDVSGVALVLHPPIAIPVEVRRDVPQPSGQNSILTVSIQAMSATDEQSNGYASFEGTPENQHLVLHLAESGTYNLSITPNGIGYVQSATCGNTDLLSEPLIVPDSGNIDPIEVVLGSDGARVGGTVRGASGTAIVVAVPDDENRQPVVTGYGSQGQFSFQDLAPGDYSLYALRSSGEWDYSDRDILKPFRAKGVRVTLAPNQKADVNLNLIEADE
ncbi:MAG TPA: carboxypeptidase-like regulatory domain-containing protein [Terriglobales bacterium]|nr:carboxypeptidase-like regulatory domain-containing protein [Terriglobales bacterium]